MPLQVYIYASSASNTWPEYAISRASHGMMQPARSEIRAAPIIVGANSRQASSYFLLNSVHGVPCQAGKSWKRYRFSSSSSYTIRENRWNRFHFACLPFERGNWPPTNVFLKRFFRETEATTRGSSYCFSWLGYFCWNEARPRFFSSNVASLLFPFWKQKQPVRAYPKLLLSSSSSWSVVVIFENASIDESFAHLLAIFTRIIRCVSWINY